MGAFLLLSCFATTLVMLVLSDKYSFFDVATDKRIDSDTVFATIPASSSGHCAAECLAAADCMACNWHEASRLCELLGAHETPVAVQGYIAFTRFCKLTQKGREFQGTMAVSSSGRICQHWAKNCDPHCHGNRVEMFLGGVFPENYCRNPDGEPGGPWCYTTDPDTRWEYCDVPDC